MNNQSENRISIINHSQAEELEIPLVEDDQDDISFTQKAFELQKGTNNPYFVKGGVDTLEFLRQEGEYEDASRPDILLLNLNLQTLDGDEVLEEMQKDEDLNKISVVVLTSSDAEEDVVRSYELSANAYMTKHIYFDGFLEVVDSIEHFCASFAKLPT